MENDSKPAIRAQNIANGSACTSTNISNTSNITNPIRRASSSSITVKSNARKSINSSQSECASTSSRNILNKPSSADISPDDVVMLEDDNTSFSEARIKKNVFTPLSRHHLYLLPKKTAIIHN